MKPILKNSTAALAVTSALFAFALVASPSRASASDQTQTDAIVAEPSASETIIVLGQTTGLLKVSGSGATVDEVDMSRSRIATVNDALRQVPGVFARDEEGLGLRPNIGIRGLSPIRSTKVLLLEDGIPLGSAPYGDNAAYYHPSVRRFTRIEVLKGASQIRFGPNTIGGVVNYVTRAAPDQFEGRLALSAGNRNYREGDLEIGGPIGAATALFHATAALSDGARKNQTLRYQDLYLKIDRQFGEHHNVTWRLSQFDEDSQITYSGLTQAEFEADPRQNPFKNDSFVTQKVSTSLLWNWQLWDSFSLKTTAYVSWFDRDWWRQSSNSTQRPNDASDPACGGLANLSTTCGNEGRLREYNTHGIETRLSHQGALAGISFESEMGLRYADERQNRLQLNADTPTGRTPGTSINGGVRENNLRYIKAWSGFFTTKASVGPLSLSPGVRVEDISMRRVNRLNASAPIGGTAEIFEVIPGLGVTYELGERLVVFGGVHRGFAPPRVEDAISNTSGASVNLDAETSTNWELGMRGALHKGLNIDLALFSMKFDNQIVANSVAGGVGSSLTSAGQTNHQGLEASAQGSFKELGLTGQHDIYFRSALTWVANANFEGARFSNISGFQTRSVSGNRLPYAPELLISAALGYNLTDWGNVELEYVYTDKMFTDDLNTLTPTADGQRGLIPSSSVLNATLNLTPTNWKFGWYVTVKNLTNELTIVDRARGILPGSPRLVQTGIIAKF